MLLSIGTGCLLLVNTSIHSGRYIPIEESALQETNKYFFNYYDKKGRVSRQIRNKFSPVQIVVSYVDNEMDPIFY